MGLINRRTRETVGGIKVVIRPISIDLGGLYVRYGCVVILRAIRRRRRGAVVVIENHYFGNINDGIPGAREELGLIRRNNTRSEGDRRTSLSEYLIYFRKGSPGLPIKGVISTIRIRKGSDEETFSVSAGRIQSDYVVPHPPRI